jgi:hypothetical protein
VFAKAAKMSAPHASSYRPSRIRAGDDERPALVLHESNDSALGAFSGQPTPHIHAETDSAAHLRAELAACVAAAELALMQEQMEKWRAIALEREAALQRADAAITGLSEAITALSRKTPALYPCTADEVPLVVWPPKPN